MKLIEFAVGEFNFVSCSEDGICFGFGGVTDALSFDSMRKMASAVVRKIAPRWRKSKSSNVNTVMLSKLKRARPPENVLRLYGVAVVFWRLIANLLSGALVRTQSINSVKMGRKT